MVSHDFATRDEQSWLPDLTAVETKGGYLILDYHTPASCSGVCLNSLCLQLAAKMDDTILNIDCNSDLPTRHSVTKKDFEIQCNSNRFMFDPRNRNSCIPDSEQFISENSIENLNVPKWCIGKLLVDTVRGDNKVSLFCFVLLTSL